MTIQIDGITLTAKRLLESFRWSDLTKITITERSDSSYYRPIYNAEIDGGFKMEIGKDDRLRIAPVESGLGWAVLDGDMFIEARVFL